MSKYTNGPWHWAVNKKHKVVELVCATHEIMRFERYGMQGAQPTFLSECKKYQGEKSSDLAVEVEGREHHSDWFMTIDHPDARLIAAAPDLYEALKDLHEAILENNLTPAHKNQALKALAKAYGIN